MTPVRKKNLKRLLAPQHIAFVGGDEAESAARQAANAGFEGEIWGVNPNRRRLGEYPCFSNLQDLPNSPDATFLAIPRQQIVEAVTQLAAIGAGGVVCYTAGFGELGQDGAQLEDKLVTAAQDLALVGPNVFGLLNNVTGAHLWPYSHGSKRTTIGPAIISQSGMLSSSLTFNQRSLSFSYVIGAGNQSVLAIEDYLEALVDDPAVSAFGLYVETVRNVSRFADAAIRALKNRIPIVALKVGKSQLAARTTITHTGSLSGDRELYEALFERLGIVSVPTPSILLETLKMMTFAGIPNSNRLAAFTCSGGDVAMLADCGADTGILFPQPSLGVQENLGHILPEIASISNPLDYTTPLWGQKNILEKVFLAALADDYDAALLVQDYPPPNFTEDRSLYYADAEAFISATKRAGIPAAICSSVPENMDSAIREFLVSRGIAPLQGVQEAVSAIFGASRFGAKRDEYKGRLNTLRLNSLKIDGERITLQDEWQCKNLLASYNIPIPRGTLTTAADAPNAAAKIGFPVVVKLVDQTITHKTEINAIQLDLGSENEVATAIDTILKNTKPKHGDFGQPTFLVEEMIEDVLAELLLGVVNHPQFGSVMTVGAGGVMVELLRDTHTILLPASRVEINRALDTLQISKVLDGYRNHPKVNREIVIDVILNIARLTEHLGNRLGELELNPILLRAEDAVVADALIRMVPPGDA